MYHRVTEDPAAAGPLTVTRTQLREQMAHVARAGYTVVTLGEVMAAAEGNAELPGNAVLVTFDDAYVDTLTLAQPVLAEFDWTATVFVPTAYVGATSAWDADAQPVMTWTQLRAIAATGWALGLHSHTHRNFAALTVAEAREEVARCREAFVAARVAFFPALAYPYGGRPKDKHRRAEMFAALAAEGVAMAWRIGGRVNRWPVRERWELNRIDVRGDRPLADFRRKLRWGRWW